MKRLLAVLSFTCLSVVCFAQTDTAVVNDTKRFQGELKTEYENPNTTPLKRESKKNF